ncbi:uncharacterized protein MONOS_8488 [Monocercomonoides exilis]|uniref:uncharacterized protein n=1 Tax=Monocercomonoides exilis TaxID=2049356 RepID=UPI00355A4D7B|nr:hypothetical protein MONOS_8488 [Monocercomonoides exilis]|eukprot:MONOS_8488.1-p1 / transcript=MONOS_8488.1 / gene=MONOS_8488 / organism=Monocercomonoides_exilis_PA203 / gene_product=unspecified product / transcript_product=unspecified product / location=Mono_scaffold00321:11170-15216(-) / protein_length=1349 / sequence_SO=supercontig / SO=protein_coding / is_pseudo=false
MAQSAVTSGDASFTNCIWTDVAESIIFSSNGQLSVDKCILGTSKSQSVMGPAIQCRTERAIISITNSIISNYTYNFSGGGVFFADVKSVELIQLQTINCSTNHVGGGVDIRNNVDRANIIQCKFLNCSKRTTAFDYGAGLSFWENGWGRVSDCIFGGCTSQVSGGGFGIGETGTKQSVLLYCYFENNCAQVSGADIFVCTDREMCLPKENVVYCRSSTISEVSRVQIGAGDFDDWVPRCYDPIFINSQIGEDNETCGSFDQIDGISRACKTFSYGIQMANPAIDTKTFKFGNGDYAEKHTEVGFEKWKLEGSDKEMITIRSKETEEVLFEIEGGSLDVSCISLVHDLNYSSVESSLLRVSNPTGSAAFSKCKIKCELSELKMLRKWLIEIASGTLRLEDCEVGELVLEGKSLMMLASGSSVKMINVRFSSISRNDGSGSVVEKEMTENEELLLNNISLSECECTNGDGGGLCIFVRTGCLLKIGNNSDSTFIEKCVAGSNETSVGKGGGIILSIDGKDCEFVLKHTLFGEGNKAWRGDNLFICSVSLFDVVDEEHFGTLISPDRNADNKAMGYEGEMTDYVIPLSLYFVSDLEQQMFVGGDNMKDFSRCGFSGFPCQTISHFIRMRNITESRKIILQAPFCLSETLNLTDSKWNISCKMRKTIITVDASENSCPTGMINSRTESWLYNICFTLSSSLATSEWFINCESSTLSLMQCSAKQNYIATNEDIAGWSFFGVFGGMLKMESFEIKKWISTGKHSFIECNKGSGCINIIGCSFENVEKTGDSGGCIFYELGSEATLERDDCVLINECNFSNCCAYDVGSKGGGIYILLKGSERIEVNGTSVIDGCKAENYGENEGNGGRGGGMFVLMESEGCGLTIGENVELSKVKKNEASYGKDVFVLCESGVFLESKVNTSSFAFFDTSIIPSDVLKLSGSENGEESGVIPLFVYLCTMGTKVLVDGSGGNGKDHSHCGFDGFRCLTIDYCANSRMSESFKEIEVVSSSSITKEITGPSFGVIISGRIASSDGERMRVNVSDGGSDTQDWLVGCSSSLTMSLLSFVVKGQLNSRRSAFIHSTSTLSMTNCSVSFENGALINEKIGYSIIVMAGGNLIVDGFVMESGVTLTMNGKSPITMTSGVQLELKNSRVNGVEMIGADGGCLNVGMGVNGNVKIEESNFSSRCTGGSGMKGGGMMISIGSGGTLRVKGVKLSGCEVPFEDVENGGRGIGGGMFVELPNLMETFILELMTFESCNAWKGKNVFVSGWDLIVIVNKEHFKWEMSDEELVSLDELCGWERKTTGEKYVIPLVVYLWNNWSGNGYVSGDGGGDFSGCGYSEAPCSSIDHLVSL